MDLCGEFKSLLDNGTDETELQSFLEKHPEILISTFNQGAHCPIVFPKFRLADQFIPDFIIIGHRSVYSWDVDLIEIEPSILDRQLFNSRRQSSGRLRDAEAQITDWRNWIRVNTQFFVNRALTKLKEQKAWDSRPEFYNLSDGNHQDMVVWYRIVIGRRSDFCGWGDQYRITTWEDSGYRIEIVTWDRLLDKARFVVG